MKYYLMNSNPLWQYTLEDVLRAIDERLDAREREAHETKKANDKSEDVMVIGYKAAAEALECSMPTIGRRMASGAWDGAFYRDGGRIIFNISEIKRRIQAYRGRRGRNN